MSNQTAGSQGQLYGANFWDRQGLGIKWLEASDPFIGHPHYLKVATGTFDTTGTWSTAASHTVAVVTGLARVRMIVEVAATLASASTTGTIALGVYGNASAIMPATAANGTLFLTGDILSAVYGSAGTTPHFVSNFRSPLTACCFDFVANGKNIGYTVATNALTAGELYFRIWWNSLSSTGKVTAGTGVALA